MDEDDNDDDDGDDDDDDDDVDDDDDDEVFEGPAHCLPHGQVWADWVLAEQTKTLKQQIVVAERPLAQGEPVLALPLSHETQTSKFTGFGRFWWTFGLPTCDLRYDLVLNRCRGTYSSRCPREFGTEDMLDC